MNFTRQSVLGIIMFLMGIVMLFAMIQQVASHKGKTSEPTEVVTTASQTDNNNGSTLEVQPITTDVDTESRLLDAKQKQREERVKEQEARAKSFLKEQQQAEKTALAKAQAETQAFRKKALEAKKKAEAEKAAKEAERQAKAYSANNNSNNAIELKQEITRPVVSSRQAAKEAQLEKEREARYAREEAQRRKSEKASAAHALRQAELKAKSAKQKQVDKQADENSEAPKKAFKYKVVSGDTLVGLSYRYHVKIAALAYKNKLSIKDKLFVGQVLTIPGKKEIPGLLKAAAVAKKREATLQAKRDAERKAKQAKELKAKQAADKKAEAQKQAELKAAADKKAAETAKEDKTTTAKTSANQKLKEARKKVKETKAKGTFGVQVALAANQANADKIASVYKKAGYKVGTSKTSRGVRVMVGPERGKIAALALRDKINSDPKVDVHNAWVLYWR